VMSSNLGRRKPALRAAEESVRIYRRLAITNSALEPSLNQALRSISRVRAAK
jgi:hypothetical protein